MIAIALPLQQVFRPGVSGEGVHHLHGLRARLSSLPLSSSCYLSGLVIIVIIINLHDHDHCHQFYYQIVFSRIVATCWCREPIAVLSVELTSLMLSTSIDVEIYHHSSLGD